MCDTLVATGTATSDGAVWFAKNSDREPGEAQVVEVHDGRAYSGNPSVRCTHLAIPQVSRTHTVLLSRPAWMWGCEMGANEHGVVAGNQAVFTRMPVQAEGLTGMDLMRLTLERAATAADAVDTLVGLLGAHGQGGRAGFRNHRFRYHNAFVIADRREAWVLETADRFWAAERVAGARTISNVLSIGSRFDRIHPEAVDFARARGWVSRGKDFDFAQAFGSPAYRILSGGDARRACTLGHLNAGPVGFASLAAALRDHRGRHPAAGLRLTAPCAHASFWPTRAAGQTTGSMISRLGSEGASHWLTGTSSPCLSAFKPVPMDGAFTAGATPAPEGWDAQSLFWAHERLHRTVLNDYVRQRARFEDARAAFEARAWTSGAQQGSALWKEHRAHVDEWRARLDVEPPWHSPFVHYWRHQSRKDRIPLDCRA